MVPGRTHRTKAVRASPPMTASTAATPAPAAYSAALVGVRVHQGIGIDRVVAVLGHVLAQTVQVLNGMDPQNVVARGLRRLAIV